MGAQKKKNGKNVLTYFLEREDSEGKYLRERIGNECHEKTRGTTGAKGGGDKPQKS